MLKVNLRKMNYKSKLKTIVKKNNFIYQNLRKIRSLIRSDKDGFDVLLYIFYKAICKSFYNKPNNILNEQLIRDFHKRNILVLNSYVPQEKVDVMANSFEENIKKNKISSKHLKENIVSKNPILKVIHYIVDRYIKNIVYYYGYPRHYLDQVNQVIDPLNNIEGFREELELNFLPVLNDLMHSNTDIYRTWVYKTINIDGKETGNVQNSLHRDGDLGSAIKCIIYLCDVDENNGPFSFQDIDGKVKPVIGKKGTAVFFKCAFLRHKGANTLTRDRLAASFTSYPNLKNKIANHELRPDFIRKTIPFLPKSSDSFLVN